MPGTERFAIFVAVSFFVFIVVLRLVLRRRPSQSWPLMVALSAIVVVGGMLFARWGQNTGLPWWVYYTAPALATFLLPPLVLRMSGRESGNYLLLAVCMAPAIHAFFAFFIGWPDYMPFIPIPSMSDLLKH